MQMIDYNSSIMPAYFSKLEAKPVAWTRDMLQKSNDYILFKIVI